MASVGRNKYPMIVRDDFLRYAWVYFISHKSDATEAFEKILADLRVEGVPSEVVVSHRPPFLSRALTVQRENDQKVHGPK